VVVSMSAEGDSMVAAEVTMVTAADVPTSVTMVEATTVDVADTTGMVEIGVIHTTVTAGDGDSGLAGRIGDGDTRMATAIALGMPPTLTITRSIVLRAIHVLPMGPMPLRQGIPVQNPGATSGSLRDHQ